MRKTHTIHWQYKKPTHVHTHKGQSCSFSQKISIGRGSSGNRCPNLTYTPFNSFGGYQKVPNTMGTSIDVTKNKLLSIHYWSQSGLNSPTMKAPVLHNLDSDFLVFLLCVEKHWGLLSLKAGLLDFYTQQLFSEGRTMNNSYCSMHIYYCILSVKVQVTNNIILGNSYILKTMAPRWKLSY